MTAGTWLLVVGLCDLLRAARDTTTARRRVLLTLVGVLLLVVVAVLADSSARWWATVGAVWVGGLTAWVVTSSAALDPASRRPVLWRTTAFASFGLPLAALALLAPRDFSAPWLPATLEGDASRTMIVLGALAVMVSTSNVLVRMLLDAIGVPAAVNEKRLKGGRVLGPMERVYLVLMALLGQIGAGSLVVAAKALLRYPELRRADDGRTGDRGGGESGDAAATDTSEYFLVGSFASWLLATGAWGLVRFLS